MAEFFGVIMRGLGAVISAVYQVIPSYAVAIVILTLIVRVVLIPLTVKQIRSMNAMQKIQPELKRVQQKYKGDRPKMNEEMMRLYKEHGVNPLGGCLPLLMQAPVFIALFSVLRAAVPAVAVPPPSTTVPEGFFQEGKTTLCRPGGAPAATGEGPMEIVCTVDGGEPITITIQEWRDAKGGAISAPPYMTSCTARNLRSSGGTFDFVCKSPGGTGHLPKDSKLFGDIVLDKTKFAGMELGCSPTQAVSKTGIQQCAPANTKPARFPGLIGYYLLVALMVGTTYYQQKQMSARAQGPQAAQMQMMTRIMPFFLGFISLSIPAGVCIYWVVSNIWTIGQQTVFLKKQGPPGATASPDGDKSRGGGAPKLGKPANPGNGGKQRKPGQSKQGKDKPNR